VKIGQEIGLFWAFVGPIIMVLVTAHGGGVGGYWGEQVVVMGGRIPLGEPTEKLHGTGEATARLIFEGGWDSILRALLAHLKQDMSWVL